MTPPPVLENLNPGIRRTVALIRARGFRTCDSGDGETHEHPCDREHGYVVVQVEPARLVEEADRLASVLAGAGVRLAPQELEPVDGLSHIQASYCPVERIALLDVSPIHDRQLRSGL